MYLKNKNVRITVRLNSKQFDYVKSVSDLMNISPSAFLRLLVTQAMFTDVSDEDIKSDVDSRQLKL